MFSPLAVITAVTTWITLVGPESKLILWNSAQNGHRITKGQAGGQAMVGSRSRSTAKQEAAIVALLTQRNVEEAARAAKVPARTLFRWLKEPEFNAAYRNAKRAAFSQSIARLHQMTSAAVTTLAKLMTDPTTPASTRVRAADSVLDHAAKAIEIEDIEARVTELEQVAEASRANRR